MNKKTEEEKIAHRKEYQKEYHKKYLEKKKEELHKLRADRGEEVIKKRGRKLGTIVTKKIDSILDDTIDMEPKKRGRKIGQGNCIYKLTFKGIVYLCKNQKEIEEITNLNQDCISRILLNKNTYRRYDKKYLKEIKIEKYLKNNV